MNAFGMKSRTPRMMNWAGVLIAVAAIPCVAGTTTERKEAQVWVDKGIAIGDNSDGEAECYRKAIEIDPAYAAAHFNLGYVLHKQGNFADALKEYRRCLHYDPDRKEALLNAGHVTLLAERDAEIARQYLNRYAEILDSDPNADKKELRRIEDEVRELETEIAAQKACTFQEFYTAETIIEILTRRITRPADKTVYSAGHVPIRLFGEGSAGLTPQAKSQLDEVARALEDPRFAETTIVIEGHADSLEDSRANLALSARRATAGAGYLVNHWEIPWNKLLVRWYGEDRPVAPNDTPEGRAKNRRIEVNNEVACW